MRSWPGVALPGAAVALAAWSLLPFGSLWDGVAPGYFTSSWQTWAWGTLLAGLLAAVILAPGDGRAARALPALWRRVMELPAPVFLGLALLLLAALSLCFTLFVFAGNPRNVDGFAQLFQARIFLAGRTWLAPPAELASFGTLQMILGPDKWYSQYPPGQPLVLAAGLLAGAWWLLNPLIVTAFGLATWYVARWCADESTARLAVVLACLSPFVLAVAGSEMSHLPAAALGMGAAAFAVRSVARGSLPGAATAGLLLGLMTAFRPLDAVAAAVPVAVILWGWSPVRLPAFAAVITAGIAGSLPTLWYNGRTTGSWLEFGYSVLWGPQHSLGFHPVPFGTPLTFTRAIARSGMDLHQLNMYLLDSPLPVLAVMALGYVAGRRLLGPRDAVPFAAVGALVGLLFFYWHRDTFYGPRFLYSVVAWLVLMLARSLVLLRRCRPPSGTARDAGLHATFSVVVAIVVGLVTIAPGRLSAYRESTPGFSLHPDRDAVRAGVSNAVVVIPDGWGARLIARLWQHGITVRASSRLYGAIDACTLERALAEADSSAAHSGAALAARLDSLAALRRPGTPGRVTADPNLRLQPDEVLAPECVREIEIDQRGFYQYAPYLWLNSAGLDGDVVWARDLGPGNAALFRRYAGRRFYRYVPGQQREPLLLPLNGPGW